MEAVDLSQVPVVDNHCHGVTTDQAFGDVVEVGGQRLLRVGEGLLLGEEALHQDLEPQHRLGPAVREFSQFRYR